MRIKNCRVCQQPLYSEPLLRYENMPKSAQFLPDEHTLVDDESVSIEVCQCSGCGLVQLNNEAVHYYKEVIRAAGLSDEMNAFRKQQFSQWIKTYKLESKKIIEIGCGVGEFLIIMQANNIKAYGIEFSSKAVRLCENQGLNVRQDFISQPIQTLKNHPFDAFYMLNFLEHLPDPNATLAGICNNLSEGAIGLIEVPNFDMILRENLFSEFISDHLFYFTKETFIATLSRNGFEIIECKEVWHDYSLSAVVRKRRKTDLLPFSQYQKSLTKQLNNYIAQFPANSVAIWGAGHQALAVMSLANLAGKIKYVIDSAAFKQNKFTPATHIPIVAPTILDEDPVEAIIIMAASYTDEVLVNLRQEHGKRFNVAALNGTELTICIK